MTNKRKPWQTFALYAFVFVMSVIILYPYVIMFITALKNNDEMYAGNILPQIWQWANFGDIWSAAPVLKYLANSMIIAGGATLLAILCGIPAAYALARMKFKGKGFFMGAVIMSQMFSPVVLLVGIYRLMVTLNLTDNIIGLILLNAAFNQAFAIWLLRGTFVSISPEMEQAAKIDGCGTVKALIKVLLPMAAPGIITTLIFVFINAWNEYTIAVSVCNIFSCYNTSSCTLPLDRKTSCCRTYIRWCKRLRKLTGSFQVSCLQILERALFLFYTIS